MAIMNDSNADKMIIIIRYLAIKINNLNNGLMADMCMCVYIFNVYVGANVYGCVPIFNL